MQISSISNDNSTSKNFQISSETEQNNNTKRQYANKLLKHGDTALTAIAAVGTAASTTSLLLAGANIMKGKIESSSVPPTAMVSLALSGIGTLTGMTQKYMGTALQCSTFAAVALTASVGFSYAIKEPEIKSNILPLHNKELKAL